MLRERRQYSAVSHPAALRARKVRLHFVVRKTVGYPMGNEAKLQSDGQTSLLLGQFRAFAERK